jgi:hypothetical protein
MAQAQTLIALILHGAEQVEGGDAVYVQALVQAEASGSPGVVEYVENIGKQWLA